MHLSTASENVAVQEFTAERPDQSSVICRGVGPVTTPNGEPFREYIRQALIGDLKRLRLYDPGASKRIGAHLKSIDADSMTAKWVITMEVTITDHPPFEITASHVFPFIFAGDSACHDMAERFPIVVQKLIEELTGRPELLDAVSH
jgi:hypothetical protein